MTKAVSIYLLIALSLVAQTGTQKAPPRKTDKGPAAAGRSTSAATTQPTAQTADQLFVEEGLKLLKQDSDLLDAGTLLGETHITPHYLFNSLVWDVNTLATEPYNAPADINGHLQPPIHDDERTKKNKFLELLRLPEDNGTKENMKKRREKIDFLQDIVDQYEKVCGPGSRMDARACRIDPEHPLR
jgi:hypothetical protein